MKWRDLYKLVGIILVFYGLIYGMVATLPTAESLKQLGQSGRNIFYHVPLWFAVIAMMSLSVWQSILFLRLSDPDKPTGLSPLLVDARAQVAASVGVMFIMLGLLTGMIWSRVTWGEAINNSFDFSAWWIWDPIQVCALISLLIYCAYFLLRTSFSDQEQRAKAAAVYNIFAFATLIPLYFIVPKMLPGAHPTAEKGSFIFDSNDINNNFRIILYPTMIGMILIGIWLYELRYRVVYLKLNMESYIADRDFIKELHKHSSNQS